VIGSLRGKKIVRKIKISFCHGLVEIEDRYRKINRRKRGESEMEESNESECGFEDRSTSQREF